MLCVFQCWLYYKSKMCKVDLSIYAIVTRQQCNRTIFNMSNKRRFFLLSSTLDRLNSVTVFVTLSDSNNPLQIAQLFFLFSQTVYILFTSLDPYCAAVFNNASDMSDMSSLPVDKISHIFL